MSIVLFLFLGSTDTLHLTFEEALERAYHTAPDIRLSELEIDQKELEQNKVLSEFFPKISGQSQVMRLDEVPSFNFEIVPGFSKQLTFGDEYIELIQGGIQLPLWTFGRRLEGYALAGEAIELARLDSLEVARVVRLQVSELYVNIISLAEAERLTQTAIENTSRHRKNIEDKYEQGLCSHYDLLDAQTKEAELTPELIDVRQQRAQLISRLGIILDLGTDTVLVLEPYRELPDSALEDFSLEKIIECRPAWQQIEMGQRMIERQIKIKQREALPVLAASANYTVQRSPLTEGEWDKGWSYSIVAQAPISNGFANYVEVKKLEKESQKLAIQADALKAQIRFEVEEVRGGAQTSYARLQAMRYKEKQAEELLSIVSKRYKEGLSSDVDLLDAELGLRKARTDRIMAESEVIISHERWMNVIGGEK